MTDRILNFIKRRGLISLVKELPTVGKLERFRKSRGGLSFKHTESFTWRRQASGGKVMYPLASLSIPGIKSTEVLDFIHRILTELMSSQGEKIFMAIRRRTHSLSLSLATKLTV